MRWMNQEDGAQEACMSRTACRVHVLPGHESLRLRRLHTTGCMHGVSRAHGCREHEGGLHLAHEVGRVVRQAQDARQDLGPQGRAARLRAQRAQQLRDHTPHLGTCSHTHVRKALPWHALARGVCAVGLALASSCQAKIARVTSLWHGVQ